MSLIPPMTVTPPTTAAVQGSLITSTARFQTTSLGMFCVSSSEAILEPVFKPLTVSMDDMDCRDIRHIQGIARTTRIVGGFPAQQGVFDSFASVNYGFGINPICGATIIDSCTVLTAAHCIIQRYLPLMSVSVGDHTRIRSTSQLRVRKVYVHKYYNTQTTQNDIAILKIDRIDTKAIPNTAPACFATADFPLEGTYCTAVGIGNTRHGGHPPFNFRLQQVSIPTWDGITCSRDMRFLTPVTDPPNQICSGTYGKSTCQGDSGGGLFCNQDGQQVLTGVVSYGVGCGLPLFPGVYMKVSSYADWIAAHSGC
ncbi:trypsin eta-like [Haliotis asinina]|uniref:trypsin eta-like n=1 Tax=Haliotis asinina TaxID=109174 RepID=UPI00353212CE